MGKVRRQRNKRHLVAHAQTQAQGGDGVAAPAVETMDIELALATAVDTVPMGGAPAADDAAPPGHKAVTAKQATAAGKKERRLQRRQQFLAKLDASQQEKRDAVRRKKSAEQPLKDFTDIVDALGLTEAEGGAPQRKRTPRHKKRVTSKRGRAHALVTETLRLQHVLQHPKFKEDPLTAIHRHLEATLAAEHKAEAAAS